ncbi:MAG: hypothetical protein KDK41_01210, partial [Leptospiraceae bacterium]|nr:hypothetical protein [Leptospiraceae bacterium]
MKKFIIKIFVFSIIFTIFYCFMIVVFGKYKFFDSTIILHKPPTGDFQYTRLEEVKDFNTVDVLFVGSSHAYRG